MTENFSQTIVYLNGRSNAFTISKYGNFKTKHSIFGTTCKYGNHEDSYGSLPFSFNPKIISLISLHLISVLFYSKIYSRKETSPNHLEFSKNQARNGRVVWFQKSCKENIQFVPCFQLFKKNAFGQLEKPQQVYFGEQEVEKISNIRKTVIHDAKNFELKPIYEAKYGKQLTVGDSTTSVLEYLKLQHTNQEMQCEQTILHSDSRLHCKGERSLEAICLCQLYFALTQRTVQISERLYVC